MRNENEKVESNRGKIRKIIGDLGQIDGSQGSGFEATRVMVDMMIDKARINKIFRGGGIQKASGQGLLGIRAESIIVIAKENDDVADVVAFGVKIWDGIVSVNNSSE